MHVTVFPGAQYGNDLNRESRAKFTAIHTHMQQLCLTMPLNSYTYMYVHSRYLMTKMVLAIIIVVFLNMVANG